MHLKLVFYNIDIEGTIPANNFNFKVFLYWKSCYSPSQEEEHRKEEKIIPLTALFLLFKKGTLYFYFVLCPANFAASPYVDILCEKTLLLMLK